MKQHKEYVSIVIPLYNKENTIFSTIHSVLSQSYPYFELIIIDDGSTDGSLSIVQSVQDERIHIISKQNEGVSATRNLGAKESKYDILYFMDADDIAEPNALEILITLKQHYTEADCWCANYKSLYKSVEKVELKHSIRGYISNPYQHLWKRSWNFRIGSFIISKASFFRIGGFPTTITIGEDYYMMDQYVEKFKCAYDPTPIMTYMKDYKSLSFKKVPVHYVFEYNIRFDVEDKSRKLNYGNMLIRRMANSLIRRNWNEIAVLLTHHKRHLAFSFYAFARAFLNKFE